jgi:D-alanyl-D-alanine dipeptidase
MTIFIQYFTSKNIRRHQIWRKWIRLKLSPNACESVFTNSVLAILELQLIMRDLQKDAEAKSGLQPHLDPQ